MNGDVRDILRREGHLNLLAYILILALMAAVGVLLFLVLATGAAPEQWLLGNNLFTWLLSVFMFAVVAYIAATHGRLRRELAASHDALERARDQVQSACDRLAFAHRTAEIMTSLNDSDALDRVLAVSAGFFDADAAAIIDDERTRLYAEDGVDRSVAEGWMHHAALDAARAGRGVAGTTTDDGSSAIAVPMRIRGRVTSVCCLWRRDGVFGPEHLDGLALVARIIELGLENRMLFESVEARLEGTLEALVTLVDLRQPEYAHHSIVVADRSAEVAEAMGLSSSAIEDIRLAGLLLDVGMLKIPDEILAADRALTPDELELVRQHPREGADLASMARFDERVQEAIHAHHERLDGSGYPRGLNRDEIPVAARILGVCDVFDSMISPRSYRPALPVETAIAELLRGSGKLYDPRVINAFLHVSGYGDALGEMQPAEASA